MPGWCMPSTASAAAAKPTMPAAASACPADDFAADNTSGAPLLPSAKAIMRCEVQSQLLGSLQQDRTMMVGNCYRNNIALD